MKIIMISIFLLIFCSLMFFLFSNESEIQPINQKLLVEYPVELVEMGKKLAAIGSCAVCHTAQSGQKYAGGLSLPTPFGTIFSTNITPDRETGIGTWSFEAFKRSMRAGVDRKGNHLYPAFPYDFFSKTTEVDLEALYAYLITLEPVISERRENELVFPFSYRPLLSVWKFFFLDRDPFEPDVEIDMDDDQKRGEYLAASLGHCGACHSPRNFLGAIQKGKSLKGGEAEGWDVPPIGPYSISPVEWSLNNYANYMFDGWDEKHGIAAGPMTSVIDHLYDADENDIYAISGWLSKISSKGTAQEETSQRFRKISSLDWMDGETFNPKNGKGEEIFVKKCTKCHKQRLNKSQPASLGLTYAINAPSPRNLFNVILNGIDPPYSVAKRKMDSIDLADGELVALANYLRRRFTNLPKWEDPQSFLGDIRKSYGH